MGDQYGEKNPDGNIVIDLDKFLALQAVYPSLRKGPLHPLVKSGLEWLGTYEFPGPDDNPIIKEWRDRMLHFYRERDPFRAAELGKYQHDSDNWCGLGCGWFLFNKGFQIPKYPLWSQAYAKLGEPRLGKPQPGDVCVTWRKDPDKKLADGQLGHAGIVVEQQVDGFVELVGANQSDAVTVMTKATDRLVGFRIITERLPA